MPVTIGTMQSRATATVTEAIAHRVLPRTALRNIGGAGITAITTQPQEYMDYYNAHRSPESPALVTESDLATHIEQLRRAMQRAQGYLRDRRVTLEHTTGVWDRGINEALAELGPGVVPMPPAAVAYPETMSPGAAAGMGYRWLSYAKKRKAWGEHQNSPRHKANEAAVRRAIQTLIYDAYGPWLGR